MIRKANKIAAFAIMLSLYQLSSAEDVINPRLSLVPGENYICSMEMSKRIKQTIGGTEQIMDQNLNIVWDYGILSKNDAGDFEISAKFSRIRSFQKFGFQTVEFDSDDTSEYIDPSMTGYKILIGSELKLQVNPEGKVRSLSGFEEIIDKIVENLKIPESPQRDEIIKGFRNQFGDEAMRQSFEQMTVFYPGHPVSIGDSWHNYFTMDVGFPMVVESDYTLTSRENGIANINVESVLRFNQNSRGIDMGAFSLIYDIAGKQKGSIKLDEASGLPVRLEIDHDFSGTVSVSEAPDLEDRSWPISADGKIVISFEKR